MVSVKHGQLSPVSCYVTGCRAAECRTAWAERVRRDRARRAQRVPDMVHGTDNGYANYRCRCEDCRAAHAQARREWQTRVEMERLVYGLRR